MICDNLSIKEGHLNFAGCDTLDLAKEYGTPLYAMDENKVRSNCRAYTRALSKHFGDKCLVLYASKALCIKEMYGIITSENMGIDVVSSGEIYTAVAAGFDMSKAVFHGNNKTPYDIDFAIQNKVGFIVCDNADELPLIENAAKKAGVKQNILIRVTPGIDPHTHDKINTGCVDSKFGVSVYGGAAFDVTKQALACQDVTLKGFQFHVGSQLFDPTPFLQAIDVMTDFMVLIKDELGYDCEILDIGGGIGVRYVEAEPQPDIEAFIDSIAKELIGCCDKKSLSLPFVCMEPGRSIVANAGITLYTVGSVKEIPDVKNYVAIDGGMADNPRYTLYSAPYTVINATKADKPNDYTCTVVGRCCESGDVIQRNVKMPKPVPGDILAVLTTGAYNYSMASNYNALLKPPIIMINDGKAHISVRRETFEDLIACQK